MEIIDTHAHLNFNAYKSDLEEVIKRTAREGIRAINVGSKFETSQRAVEIAGKYNKEFYAAIGLHPIYAAAEFVKVKTDPNEGDFLIKEQVLDREKYKKLALDNMGKVVAIGEIGLDYYYRPKTKIKFEQFKEKQKQVFIQQLELAEELDLPVILHCRMAHAEILNILKSQPPTSNGQINSEFKILNFKRGVIHCFTGSIKEAEEYIKLGFYIGINGIIDKLYLDEVIKDVPLNKILVETDCPYLTPSAAVALAKAGPKEYVRNEPIFIKHVIQKIADLKEVNFSEVAQRTTQNARELFRI